MATYAMQNTEDLLSKKTIRKCKPVLIKHLKCNGATF